MENKQKQSKNIYAVRRDSPVPIESRTRYLVEETPEGWAVFTSGPNPKRLDYSRADFEREFIALDSRG